MTRTLVTGATGFIGSHVARLLLERGDDVRGTFRSPEGGEALAERGIAPVKADILDRRAVRRALKGTDRVFHVAGSTSLTASRGVAFSVGVEGVRVVLEEALRAGAERVVYTSSVAAIGPAPAGKVATEANPWEAGGYRIPSLDAKHEAEIAALRLVARGLPLVIVNPAHVLGPGDPGRSSTTLVRRFLRRQLPVYVAGTLNVVGVQDVAAGHLLADERGAIGSRYILGNRNFTMQRLLADLGRLSGVQPPVVRLPVTVAMALSAAGERVAGVRLPTPNEVRAASLNWSVSNRKARRELGWRTSPHEDCLEETIAWYRERENERLAPPGALQPLALRAAGLAGRRLGLG